MSALFSHTKNLFGKAKWMSYFSAKKSGLLNANGIIVGEKWFSPISIPGMEHTIVFAPSGSGKTTSIVIPNLLTWDESCVIVDVKLELFEKTSGFREKNGHEVFLWNPGAKNNKTHRFNPLSLISTDKNKQIDDLYKIAQILIPDDGKTEQIWTAGPRNLFVGLGLYVLNHSDGPKTIGQILRTLTFSDDFDSFVEELTSKEGIGSLCLSFLNSYINTPSVTRGGIKASFESKLSLFNNPLVDAATSESDFNIQDLRRKKMSIYVGITNDNLVRFSPLLNIFFEQVLSALTAEEPKKDEPISVCLILDEFPALGKLEILKANIGLLRSYHIRALIIIQDIAQLREIYGRDGANIFLNLKTKVAFSQNNYEAGEYISKLAGDTTTTSASKSGKEFSFFSKKSLTESFARRPLILPQEILCLNNERAIVLMEGKNPLIVNKIYWFKNKDLAARIVDPVNVPQIPISEYQFNRSAKIKKKHEDLDLDSI